MFRYLLVLVLICVVTECYAKPGKKKIPPKKSGVRQGDWNNNEVEECCEEDQGPGWGDDTGSEQNQEQQEWGGGSDNQNDQETSTDGGDEWGSSSDTGDEWGATDASPDTGSNWGSPDAPSEGGTDQNTDDEIPDCDCVEFYLCDEQYRIITNGNGMVNWRSGVKECGDSEVCCTKPKTSQGEQPGFPEEPEEGPGDEEMRCGESRADPSVTAGDDMTGNFAQFDEFPWMLQLKNNNDDSVDSGLEEFKCGASLIHPDFALTAAHCLVDETSGNHKISAENLIVRAGEWDTLSDHEPRPYEDRQALKIHIHSEFSSKNPKNDIALIELKEPFKLSRHINTICLPGEQSLDVDHCVATGWGKLNNKASTVLRKVEMPVVPNNECQRALRLSRLGKYFLLHPSFMCAGGREGEDTCVGDGGGPLICPVRNSKAFVQLGVVSWGIECGKANRPGVYADIRAMMPWIQSILKI